MVRKLKPPDIEGGFHYPTFNTPQKPYNALPITAPTLSTLSAYYPEGSLTPHLYQKKVYPHVRIE